MNKLLFVYEYYFLLFYENSFQLKLIYLNLSISHIHNTLEYARIFNEGNALGALRAGNIRPLFIFIIGRMWIYK